jgi:FlaA1/EpsC-like NDP-sugar epimerase
MRSEVMERPLPTVSVKDPWKDKVVLLTGVAGTVGHEILSQLARRGVRGIVGVDNNESALFQIEQEYGDRDDITFRLGDISDYNSLLGLL